MDYFLELRKELKQIREEQAAIRNLLESLGVERAAALPGGNERGFLHAAEAAEMLGISKGTWFNWRKRGIISNGKLIGYNQRVWPVEEAQSLIRYIKSGEIQIRKERMA
jgi:hypothetical protein